MTNRNQPLPSLAPERDQVEAFKTTRNDSKPRPKPPSGGGSTVTTVMMYVLLVLILAGGWWFDLQNKTLQAKLDSADARIASLEEQLSATGEEMGESSVVIKARLKSLTEKSEQLWEQMDKLWASAWRKNQAEIKTVQANLAKQSKSLNTLSAQQKTASSTIKAVANKQTETDFNLGIISEQMDAAKQLDSEIARLKASISSVESKSLDKDRTQIELASNLSRLEQKVNGLIARLQTLEAKP